MVSPLWVASFYRCLPYECDKHSTDSGAWSNPSDIPHSFFQSSTEFAAIYAALILADDGIDITVSY